MFKSDQNKPISFSFSGCGFLGLYHVGVASCLREYAPISPNTRIGGASAGALAAMAMVCNLPLGESTSEILQVAIKARSRALGPFHPSFDVNKIIYDGLVKTLPDDAHLRANGRLFISVTRISDGQNVIIDQFKSKEELIKAIQCSCFIPLWSGLVPPKFNGVSYIDGGCSDNMPIIDNNTVTISPFSGESDICPQDDTYNLFQVNLANTSIALTPANFYRITRILFPAHPEVLSKMCQQGFDDALRYLQRNNKISCTRCLAIHFTLEKEDVDEDTKSVYSDQKNLMVSRRNNGDNNSSHGSRHSHADKHSMDNCRDCEYRRQIAVYDSLPESVVQAIQEACDQVNKGLINWLFRHKPMKLLSILSIPYLLPIDITIVVFTKLYERLPDIKRELKNSIMKLVQLLRSLLVKMESNRYFYSAKFSCQLAVKEFDYAKEETLRARKPSTCSVSRKKSIQQKVSAKVEKANSFPGKKISIGTNGDYQSLFDDNDSNKSTPSPIQIKSNVSPNNERFRKASYAGPEYTNIDSNPREFINRRRSMIEIGNDQQQMKSAQTMASINHQPERVISQLNFDFKLDMKNSKSDLRSSIDGIDSMIDKQTSIPDDKVLDIDLSEIDQSNAIEIANKALDWEKDLLQKFHQFKVPDGKFDKMLEITRNHDAVMAYYYTDENNKVKFTELFNITDDDLKKMDTKDVADGTMDLTNDPTTKLGDKDVDMMDDEPTEIYNDSDDGLIESSIVHVKSSLANSPTTANGEKQTIINRSPSKRLRKKSVFVD